jgi:hypothetical protein
MHNSFAEILGLRELLRFQFHFGKCTILRGHSCVSDDKLHEYVLDLSLTSLHAQN